MLWFSFNLGTNIFFLMRKKKEKGENCMRKQTIKEKRTEDQMDYTYFLRNEVIISSCTSIIFCPMYNEERQ
ncbi:hypothetical protein DXD80_14820 [Bacteroides xylanisolvens]|nr:hypothetical protein DXD80_14820 [Bacteroides xylanisolvens]RJU59775.1 hypothetical protein DW862_19780 [Bacteroides sp. AM37-9]